MAHFAAGNTPGLARRRKHCQYAQDRMPKTHIYDGLRFLRANAIIQSASIIAAIIPNTAKSEMNRVRVNTGAPPLLRRGELGLDYFRLDGISLYTSPN